LDVPPENASEVFHCVSRIPIEPYLSARVLQVDYFGIEETMDPGEFVLHLPYPPPRDAAWAPPRICDRLIPPLEAQLLPFLPALACFSAPRVLYLGPLGDGVATYIQDTYAMSRVLCTGYSVFTGDDLPAVDITEIEDVFDVIIVDRYLHHLVCRCPSYWFSVLKERLSTRGIIVVREDIWDGTQAHWVQLCTRHLRVCGTLHPPCFLTEWAVQRPAFDAGLDIMDHLPFDYCKGISPGRIYHWTRGDVDPPEKEYVISELLRFHADRMRLDPSVSSWDFSLTFSASLDADRHCYPGLSGVPTARKKPLRLGLVRFIGMNPTTARFHHDGPYLETFLSFVDLIQHLGSPAAYLDELFTFGRQTADHGRTGYPAPFVARHMSVLVDQGFVLKDNDLYSLPHDWERSLRTQLAYLRVRPFLRRPLVEPVPSLLAADVRPLDPDHPVKRR